MAELHFDMKKGLAESVPSSIRIAVEDLLGNPLWLEICRILYNVPIDGQMTQTKLIPMINDFVEKRGIRYVDLNKALDKLRQKGYIHLEHSMPEYLLTPLGVEAMRVISAIDRQIVSALVEELRSKGIANADLEELAKQGIYSDLTSE